MTLPTIERAGRFQRSDGLFLSWELHAGESTMDPPIVFVPPFNVLGRELYDAQVAHLARRHRTVVWDPIGTGGSSRSDDPAHHAVPRRMLDVLELLDHLELGPCVLAGVSLGGLVSLLVAGTAPERVVGVAGIASGTPFAFHPGLAEAALRFDEPAVEDHPWGWFNAEAAMANPERFHRAFHELAVSEPLSDVELERSYEYALATSIDDIVANVRSGGEQWAMPSQEMEAALHAIACPVLLLHGSSDEISPVAGAMQLADLVNAELRVIDGGSHAIGTRHSIVVNRYIDDFLAVLRPHPTSPVPPTKRRGHGPRVLYLSSPIGLGHVRRDLAIADELRKRCPDVDIDWLSQDPVTAVLGHHGEQVHPASRLLAPECQRLTEHATDHHLDVTLAAFESTDVLYGNFAVFQDVVENGNYDLVVGDEAWEVDWFWLDEPSAKRGRFAWLTDFVGDLPLPNSGELQRRVIHGRNRRMVHHIDRTPGVRDASIFIGDPEDVIDVSLGDGLPDLRSWVNEHFTYSGYITGFDLRSLGEREDLRADLGWHPDETVCVAAVGGSGIGAALLECVAAAHERIRSEHSGWRTVLVAGPSISVGQFAASPSLDVHGWVPDLHRMLAASDLAVVQGGLTTTMELTAAGVPFLYAPLEGHFEQQLHVDHRLRRHGVGRRVHHRIGPEELAAELLDLSSEQRRTPPAFEKGAAVVAEQLANLL